MVGGCDEYWWVCVVDSWVVNNGGYLWWVDVVNNGGYLWWVDVVILVGVMVMVLVGVGWY